MDSVGEALYHSFVHLLEEAQLGNDMDLLSFVELGNVLSASKFVEVIRRFNLYEIWVQLMSRPLAKFSNVVSWSLCRCSLNFLVVELLFLWGLRWQSALTLEDHISEQRCSVS